MSNIYFSNKSSIFMMILAGVAQTTLAQNVAEQQLETVNVSTKNRSTRTEHKNSYTTSAMKTITGLALSPKETPQSVSVITKTQLHHQGITNMEDALKQTTGVNVIRDAGRYQAAP